MSAPCLASPPLDKTLHFTASYALTTTSYQVYKKTKWKHPKTMAAITSLAIGCLKEATDREWDGGDMRANVAGVVAGAMFNVVLEF